MKILFYGFRHGHILGCYRQAQQNPEVQIVAAIEENTPARLTAEAEISKPKGSIKWSTAPVAAQVRAMLPVFMGISGSTSTMLSMAGPLLSGIRIKNPSTFIVAQLKKE